MSEANCLSNSWLLSTLWGTHIQCPSQVTRGDLCIYIVHIFPHTFTEGRLSAFFAPGCIITGLCVHTHHRSLWAGLHFSFHFPCAVHMSKPWCIYQETVINKKHEPSLSHNRFPFSVIECHIIPEAMGASFRVDAVNSPQATPGRHGAWAAATIANLHVPIQLHPHKQIWFVKDSCLKNRCSSWSDE